MDLGEARVCEECTLLVALPCCGAVAVHCVGGKEIGVSVTSGSYYDCVCAESLDFSGHEVSGYDTPGLTIDENHVEHFVTRIRLDGTLGNLTVQSRVCTEKELLSGLTPCIEGAADCSPTERAVCEESAILTCERHALSYALVNDVVADLCKTIDIGFAAAVVATFDGLVEEPVNRVIVVLVVLRSVDASLCRNGVGTAWRVADTEDFDVVTEFTERSCCRGSAQTGSDDDDIEFSLVARSDYTDVCLMVSPFFGKRSLGNLGNQFFGHFL